MTTKLSFTPFIILLLFFYSNTSFAQWNPTHPGWTDSFRANGFCWCNSTNFDHGIGDKTVTINGTGYKIIDICDELEKHPQYRSFQNGDAPYNDIQCGNGPANDAPDETGCPGRTDLGPSGCDQIGPKWDMDWLITRPRFGGDNGDGIQSEYAAHSIPGRIELEDFDNGGQGVAYNDSDSSNNGGDGRNDQAVDIQTTTDVGGGTNVGWIANGEWLEYTIENVLEGDYVASFRVASNDKNGTVTISSDGNTLGSVEVNDTGGWQNWETLSISVSLNSGPQVLRVSFSGELNMNWIEFGSTLSNNEFEVTNSIAVYPNPVETTLFVKSIDSLDKVIIADLTGRKISEHAISNQVIGINVDHLKGGLYLLLDDSNNLLHKFVKK